MVAPAEPVFDLEERRLFERGVAEFNTGLYFECHDTLEDLWSGLRGPARDFFQGLIQVSVGFYHLGGGNLSGAQSMFERALRRFQPYPDQYFGFDLAAHRREIEGWQQRLREAKPLANATAPQWHFEFRR